MNEPLERTKLLVEYIDHINTEISTEGDVLVNAVPDFMLKIINNVTSAFTSDDVTELDSKKLSFYGKELLLRRNLINNNKVEYIKVKRRKVPITPGLTGNVLAITDQLKLANRIVSEHTDKLIDTTAKIIGKMISDRDYRMALRPLPKITKEIKAVNDINGILNKVVDVNSHSDVTTVGDIAPSIPYITESTDVMISLATVDIANMYKKINENTIIINRYSKTLVDTLRGDKKLSIQKDRLSELGGYIKTSADIVTASAKVFYLTTQTTILLKDLIDIVTKNNG